VADIENIIIRPDGIVVGWMREARRGKVTSVVSSLGAWVRTDSQSGNSAINQSDLTENPIESTVLTPVIMSESLPRIEMTKYKTVMNWLMSPENSGEFKPENLIRQ